MGNVSNLRVAHLDILVHVSSWHAGKSHVEEHANELLEFWHLDVGGFVWAFLYRKQALSNKANLNVIIQLVVGIIDGIYHGISSECFAIEHRFG